ncbi:MAG: hypothetical protein U1E39_02205 [Planctomycetota bacterium]
MRWSRLVVATASIAALVGGCADVVVRKVTPENDAGLDGFRYYLPRPHLALAKETPVAGDEFVVVGEIGADGVTIPVDALPEALRYHFRGIGTGGVIVPAAEIGDGRLPDVLTKSAASDGKPTTIASGGSGTEGAGPQGTTVALASGDMSIVYLPDWDQQYAIKYKAGLGKVDTGESGLRLRHGWMLDNVSLSIDNVELGKFVFGQIDKLTDLVSLVGARKQKVLDQFSGTLTKSAEGGAKRRVHLRVTYAIVALPGIYPFLKPCEEARYRERCCGGAGTPGSSGSAHGAVTSAANWVFVPYPPFTVVAYQVKRTVAVELLSMEQPGAAGPQDAGGVTDATAVRTWVRKFVPSLKAYPDAALKIRLAPTSAGTLTAVVTVVAGAKADLVTAEAEAKKALEVEGLTVPGGTVAAMTFVPTT